MTEAKKKEVVEMSKEEAQNGIPLEEFRKRMEVAGSAAPSETQVLEQARTIQERKVQQFNKRMEALMSGKAPPPNEFVAYMLKQLRNCGAEFEAVQANIRELSKRLQGFQDRALVLQGEHNKYIHDIQQWDRSLKEKGDNQKES